MNGKVSWMKRRTKRCIRYHNIKASDSYHEFIFSEMQMYTPFTSEEELCPVNVMRCTKLYCENIEKIAYLKRKVMPHLDHVREGRARAEDFLSNIGDTLDADAEINNESAQCEGHHENDNLHIKDPQGLFFSSCDAQPHVGDKTFRKIDVQDAAQLHSKVRNLDDDQRLAVDLLLNYGHQYQKARIRHNNPWPDPPLLIVQGGAGTGKSHVIDVIAPLLQKRLTTSGDNPDHPYIIKMAFTGNAAAIIKGQTIHSVFNLPFSHNLISLSDKKRDKLRNQLQNLALIILDEMSLIGADMLYQLHFRLAKEIFQNKLPFGGISVVLLGDILQIRPTTGVFPFEEPKNKNFQLLHALDPLWNKFQCIVLKTNHRQGEDKEYADILNKIRLGQLDEHTIDILKSRVFPRNDPRLPTDAVLVSGENIIVNEYNNKKLNELHGDLHKFKATVSTSTNKNLTHVSVSNNGNVKNTPIPANLQLKKKARVMLTHNIDVSDSLTNGALGTVLDFKFNKEGIVHYILVKLDESLSGAKRREKFCLISEYPGLDATTIERIEFEYCIGRSEKGTRASAINFPLRLAWGITAHKIQGHTVKKPGTLILDLNCWLQPGMVYVMLSRV